MSSDELHEYGFAHPRGTSSTWACPIPDGLEACRRLTGAGDDTPILLLTAHDTVVGRVAGLTAGAGDSLVKPFAAQDLVARPHALLRRGRGAQRVPRLFHSVGDSGFVLREDS